MDETGNLLKANKTNKCNIEEDKRLAEQVEKYPCLYDKTDSGYKELECKIQAWNDIDTELAWETGTSKRQFEILKKRYSRKRVTLKAALRSDVGAKDIASAQKDLEEYSWLSWLDQHIRLYRKHNHSKYESQSNPDLLMRRDDSHYPHLTNINFNRASFNSHGLGENRLSRNSHYLTNHEGSQHSDRVVENEYHNNNNSNSRVNEDVYLYNSTDDEEYFPEIPTAPPKKRKRIKTENEEAEEVPSDEESQPHGTRNKRVLASIKMDIMSSISKLFQEKSDQDDLFGKMIAGELKTFPETLKYRVKHEISTVIFNYKLMHFGNSTDV